MHRDIIIDLFCFAISELWTNESASPTRTNGFWPRNAADAASATDRSEFVCVCVCVCVQIDIKASHLLLLKARSTIERCMHKNEAALSISDKSAVHYNRRLYTVTSKQAIFCSLLYIMFSHFFILLAHDY